MPKAKVKKFDRSEARRVADEMKAVIEKTASQLGITVTGFDKWRYNSTAMTLPLEFSLGEKAMEAVDAAAEQTFKRYASVFGLKPEHFGQEVNLHDGTYKIIGCKPKATKNTILVEKVKTRGGGATKPGQKYVIPHGEILRGLGDTSASVEQYEVID